MLVIRPAQPSDAQALAQLFLQARRATFTWIDPAQFQLADFALQTQGETIWVATRTEELLVGFVAVWPPTHFVHHLFVAPGYQGQGIGARLLASLRLWLPLPYTLKCLTRNTRALAFYLKNGWQQVGSGGQDDGAYYLLQLGAATSTRFNENSSLPVEER